MDRILYFRIMHKKTYDNTYRLQVFRKLVHGKDILYLQVCGNPGREQVTLLQGEMQKATERILSYGRRDEETVITSLVYDYSFEKWLETVTYEREWRRLWHLPMYDAFYEKENVLQLFESIGKDNVPGEVWILGYGPGMQEWIPQLARQVRYLTFYVEFVTGSLERFRETLEEEYGLVAQVKLVAPGEFRKQRLRSATPVLVIDFSGRDAISVIGLGKGSIWMDMDSMETKRHAMEDRKTGVQYLSLKKLWKREMQQTLDTISNFEYNTEVKLDKSGG